MLFNDRPTETDLLHRDPLAKSFSEVLLSGDLKSGFVASIEGEWGSGKTSFMNFVRGHFRASGKTCLYTEFQPWLIGDRDALVEQFLTKLRTVVQTDTPHQIARAAKSVAAAIKPYATCLKAAKFVPGSAPFHGVIDQIAGAAGAPNTKNKDLVALKQKVTKALTTLETPIVVFIDDLDRLTPSEFLEVVRVVKAVGDFPYVIYVLAYDNAYATQALQSAGVANATQYLDKIVQLRCTMPAINKRDLWQIFEECWNRLSGDFPHRFLDKHKLEDRLRQFWTPLSSALENIRDVRRVFNRVRLVVPLLNGEVNIVDVIALETIALKCAAIYEIIRQDAYVFCRGRMPFTSLSESANLDDKQRFQIARDRVVEQFKLAIPEKLCPALKQLIEALFPAIRYAQAFGNHDEQSREGHVSMSRNMDIYLHAGVTIWDISTLAINEFAYQPVERARWIEKYRLSGLLLQFIQRLGEIPALSWIDFNEGINQLIAAVPEILEAEQSVVSFRPYAYLWAVIRQHDEEMKTPSHSERLEPMLAQATQLGLAIYALLNLKGDPAVGLEPGANVASGESEIDTLIKKFTVAAKRSFDDRSIFGVRWPEHILRGWYGFDPEIFAVAANSIFDNDERTDELVLALSPLCITVRGALEAHDWEATWLGTHGGLDAWRNAATRRLVEPDLPSGLERCYRAILTGQLIDVRTGIEHER